MSKVRFQHFAWGLLAYNLAVIVGGAFVRASVSGDGCGQHWPTCGGQLIPDGTRLATWIEFGHRLSTGILLPMVIGLLVWAFRAYPKGHPVRFGSVGVLVLTLVEALIGAGLVLFRLVAHDKSVERAVAMPAHLIATFLLVMMLTLTAWWSQGGKPVRLKGQGPLAWVLGFGLLSVLLLGMTGALAALGDTLFPPGSLMEGWKRDFAPGAHFLESVRIWHPMAALSVSLYLLVATGLTMRLRPDPQVQRFAQAAVLLFALQMGVGLINLGMLAPVALQLIHLLLADLFWIALVLMSAAALAEGVPQVRLSSLRPAATGSPESEAPAVMRKAGWKDYVALTKPRVISLLLFTTITAMFIAAGTEGAATPGFWLCLAVGAGLYMAAGAANAFNMVLERDLDLAMGRTATRPTVTAVIPAVNALQFAVVLMLGSFALLWASANLLTAMLAQAGLAFYVLIYTLLLKRRTWANIVIGGAAGAFPPLVGWAAVTGNLSPLAWVLFGIIFLWTPVHFWALALMIKEDYARAGVPMLPVVRGDRATVVQIAYYTLLTVGLTAAPLMLHGANGRPGAGALYLAAAVLLNGVLVWQSVQLYRCPDRPHARALFKYSMLYLALLFLAMAVDRAPWT